MPALLIAPVPTLPDACRAPVQAADAGLALAVHDVGLLVALQVSVLLAPTYIDAGLAVSDTSGGAGSTSTVTPSKLLPELL